MKTQSISSFLKIKDYSRISEIFFISIARFTPAEKKRIEKAYLIAQEAHSGQKRQNGEDFFLHPVSVAILLCLMNLDADTIVAGLLHDTIEDTQLTHDDILQEFGDDVLLLVEGVTKINIHRQARIIRETETLRKILLAMCQDIRVIFIKLADRLHNMMTLEYLPTHRVKLIAQESLDIYAPLAERLGISFLQHALEDLAFKYLYPAEYREIQFFVQEKKDTRELILNELKQQALRAFKQKKIKAEVTTRAKHFYSIYKKIQKKDKKITEVFDMLGLRIHTQSVDDCYSVLGIVHSLWHPIIGRFKDYIANPKNNGYKALHTTVFAKEKRIIEVQIRTHSMDLRAEFGIAAHWFYKARNGEPLPAENRIDILEKLRSSNTLTLSKSKHLLREIQEEILQESIYLFTPKGHIIELPTGSSAIDFAYAIHTDIGHHAQRAKADGNPIPLNRVLENNQLIEIFTNPHGHPKRDWLKYAKTRNALLKIRIFLNKQKNPQDSLKPHEPQKNHVLNSLPIRVREPDESNDNIALVPLLFSPEEALLCIKENPLSSQKFKEDHPAFFVLGTCCQPHPKVDVIGVYSREKGIIVHTKDCPNIKQIPGLEDRLIELEWKISKNQKIYTFVINAQNNYLVLESLSSILREGTLVLINVTIEEDSYGHSLGFLKVRGSYDKAMKALQKFKAVPHLLSVRMF